MVGARAPGTEQISQRVSYFYFIFLSFLTRTKRRKIAFFEGCPVGWGGVPTGAGLVDGGVDQGPWLQGVAAGWQFQKRGRVGAWLAVPKRGKSREGLACLAVPQEGARARKGRCVIFRKLEG